MKKLKLTIELVPQTSWYNNLRSLMSKEEWNILRKKVYRDAGYQCGICHGQGPLDCHEVWEFDDTHHVQNLTSFIPLCQLCHRIKHIGLAQLDASRGGVSYEDLITHFMKINECDKKTFEQHRRTALALFAKRSQHEWRLSINNLLVE